MYLPSSLLSAWQVNRSPGRRLVCVFWPTCRVCEGLRGNDFACNNHLYQYFCTLSVINRIYFVLIWAGDGNLPSPMTDVMKRPRLAVMASRQSWVTLVAPSTYSLALAETVSSGLHQLTLTVVLLAQSDLTTVEHSLPGAYIERSGKSVSLRFFLYFP